MYAVILQYSASAEQIDELRPAHLRHLEEQFRAGYFVVAGRQRPATGGVIIARDCERNLLVDIMDSDPFVREGLSSYRIVAFCPTLVSDDVAGLATGTSARAVPSAG